MDSKAIAGLVQQKKAKDIAAAVADASQLSVGVMLGTTRTQQVLLARWCTFWLIRKHTEMSLPAIARATRRSDHTIVLHGLQRIERLLTEHPSLARFVLDIEHTLGLPAISRAS